MCSCPSILLNIICWGEQSWSGAGNRHREPQESEEEGSCGHANPSRLTSVCAEADRQS